MMHLDAETYEALVAGTLPRDRARALADHLAGDCEPCERFLAEREGTDALDGAGDAAIARALRPSPVPQDDLAFARIVRALGRGRAPRRRLLAVGAVAASLAVVAIAGALLRAPGRAPDAPVWDGVKGGAPRLASVRLRVARADGAGTAAPIAPGDRIEAGAILLFEVEADRATGLALAHAGADGAVELLWSDRVPPGRSVIGAGGRAAAFPLAGRPGRHRFFLVAADEPLAPDRVARLVRELAGGRPPEGGLAYDTVEIQAR